MVDANFAQQPPRAGRERLACDDCFGCTRDPKLRKEATKSPDTDQQGHYSPYAMN